MLLIKSLQLNENTEILFMNKLILRYMKRYISHRPKLKDLLIPENLNTSTFYNQIQK